MARVLPPRTTREAVLRDDGWVQHYCIDCDADITDPRWQTYGVNDDLQVRCRKCEDRAWARHQADRWMRD